MTTAMVLGALFGLGALASYRLLFPAPPPLEAALQRLHRRNDLVQIADVERAQQLSDTFGRVLGGPIARFVEAIGIHLEALDPDLRLVGRSLEQHLGQKALLAVTGLVLPVLFVTIVTIGGAELPFTLPIFVGLGLAILFFFVPDIILKREAEERRADFNHALGSFLDLVVISLAGGAGVESALRDAASIGDGWAFGQLRNALDVTALTGETPWAALTRLGSELGVVQLRELAASVSLAGTEGARVRDSLAAKATSLRDHALANAEAEAESTTEKMALPLILLFVGFLLLVGYPAVDAVLSGI
ncbi:MAG: type II secretion system F family protein [Acidimicrobiales bacterium]